MNKETDGATFLVEELGISEAVAVVLPPDVTDGMAVLWGGCLNPRLENCH